MKKLSLLLSLVIVFTLTACWQETAPEAPETSEATETTSADINVKVVGEGEAPEVKEPSPKSEAAKINVTVK